MRGTKVAGRYAQSLLELAEEKQLAEKVIEETNFIRKTADENRDFLNFLSNPIIDASKKISILNKIFEDFSELSLKFIQLITKNKREMFLPLIAEAYILKYKESKGIVPVTLTIAAPLSDEVKEELLGKLEKQVEGNFEVNEKIRKEILGGFIFRMGDMQIEGSVSYQLSKLKNRLTK